MDCIAMQDADSEEWKTRKEMVSVQDGYYQIVGF